MTALPPGWATRTLREIAEVRGGIQKQAKRRPIDNKYPFLRVANVLRGRLDLADVHELELFGDEIDRFRLQPGDLLVVEGNGSPNEIGRAALWTGAIADCTHQNHLIRVRPSHQVLPKYLELVWNSPETSDRVRAAAGSTSGLYTLSTSKIKSIAVPVPPIEEQRRIVELLEDHLSRLDAGLRGLAGVAVKLRALTRSILLDAVPEETPGSWTRTTVGEAGEVDLGRQRHPAWHHGPEMRPYLRVANVFEDRIDTTDLMEMDFSGVFERFKLSPGDVLLNEGQSPEFLGRPAIYRGEPPDVAFTNSILRFRAHPDVLPEWALLVFRRHMHAGRFTRESRITTNIAHLSAGRLKTVEFPKPSIHEQRRLVDLVHVRLGEVKRLDEQLAVACRRYGVLRRAVLRAAFEGRLTSRVSTVEGVLAGVG